MYDFDGDSGKILRSQHFQRGKLQDPAPGIPATQWFDKETSRRTFVEHYQTNVLRDPAPGRPSRQWFIPATGIMNYAESSKTGPLTAEQVAAFNAARATMPPPLPEALQRFKFP